MSPAELDHIRFLAASGEIRVTQHGHEAMVEDNVGLDDVLDAIANATVVEDYPFHKRGPCCLLSGKTRAGRNLHVVCTTSYPVLVIITVYEPLPSKWETPTQRRELS
jgi:hypothetical protein